MPTILLYPRSPSILVKSFTRSIIYPRHVDIIPSETTARTILEEVR